MARNYDIIGDFMNWLFFILIKKVSLTFWLVPKDADILKEFSVDDLSKVVYAVWIVLFSKIIELEMSGPHGVST